MLKLTNCVISKCIELLRPLQKKMKVLLSIKVIVFSLSRRHARNFLRKALSLIIFSHTRMDVVRMNIYCDAQLYIVPSYPSYCTTGETDAPFLWRWSLDKVTASDEPKAFPLLLRILAGPLKVVSLDQGAQPNVCIPRIF